jgi:hypothetical protein
VPPGVLLRLDAVVLVEQPGIRPCPPSRATARSRRAQLHASDLRLPFPSSALVVALSTAPSALQLPYAGGGWRARPVRRGRERLSSVRVAPDCDYCDFNSLAPVSSSVSLRCVLLTYYLNKAVFARRTTRSAPTPPEHRVRSLTRHAHGACSSTSTSRSRALRPVRPPAYLVHLALTCTNRPDVATPAPHADAFMPTPVCSRASAILRRPRGCLRKPFRWRASLAAQAPCGSGAGPRSSRSPCPLARRPTPAAPAPASSGARPRHPSAAVRATRFPSPRRRAMGPTGARSRTRARQTSHHPCMCPKPHLQHRTDGRRMFSSSMAECMLPRARVPFVPD